MDNAKLCDDALILCGRELDIFLLSRIVKNESKLSDTPVMLFWPFIRNLILTSLSQNYIAPAPFVVASPAKVEVFLCNQMESILSLFNNLIYECKQKSTAQENITYAFSIESVFTRGLTSSYWRPFWHVAMRHGWDVLFVPRGTMASHQYLPSSNLELFGSTCGALLAHIDEACYSITGKYLNTPIILRFLLQIIQGSVSLARHCLDSSFLPCRAIIDNCMEIESYSISFFFKAMQLPVYEVNHGCLYEQKYLLALDLAEVIYPEAAVKSHIDALIVADTLQSHLAHLLAGEGWALPSVIHPQTSSVIETGSLAVLSTQLAVAKVIRILYLDVFVAGAHPRSTSIPDDLMLQLKKEADVLLMLPKIFRSPDIVIRPHPLVGLNPFVEQLIEGLTEVASIRISNSSAISIREDLRECDIAIVSPRSSSWADCFEAGVPFFFSCQTKISDLLSQILDYSPNPTGLLTLALGHAKKP